jgi:hypothetical protein
MTKTKVSTINGSPTPFETSTPQVHLHSTPASSFESPYEKWSSAILTTKRIGCTVSPFTGRGHTARIHPYNVCKLAWPPSWVLDNRIIYDHTNKTPDTSLHHTLSFLFPPFVQTPSRSVIPWVKVWRSKSL